MPCVLYPCTLYVENAVPSPHARRLTQKRAHRKSHTHIHTYIQPPSCFEGSSGGGASGVRNDGKLSSENASRPFFVVPAKCVLASLFFLSSHLHTPHRSRRGVRFDGAQHHHHHPALIQENTPGAHKMSTLCVCVVCPGRVGRWLDGGKTHLERRHWIPFRDLLRWK